MQRQALEGMGDESSAGVQLESWERAAKKRPMGRWGEGGVASNQGDGQGIYAQLQTSDGLRSARWWASLFVSC